MQKLWVIYIGAAVIAICIAGTIAYLLVTGISPPSNTTAGQKLIRVGLSMDTLSELRWQSDKDLLTQRAAQDGATLVTEVANSDDATQISQIEDLIAQKVDVIIIIAHNAQALSAAINDAHTAGIKVVAYDRLILNSDVDLYVSFDSTKVGEYAAQYVLQAVPASTSPVHVAYIGGAPTDNNAALVRNGAMSVLGPLISSGKVVLVLDKPTDNWDPQIAYENMKTFLDAGGKVDAVVAANDGTAGGVIQALSEHGLAGKVPLSGQDADLPALQRIVQGTQTVTSYKPIAQEAQVAMDDAVGLAKGTDPEVNTTVDNGLKSVPSYLIDPIPVTKDNIKETVIADGFHSAIEIYGTSSMPTN